MKRNNISATGTISDDGKLRMHMGALNEFFADHKGERIIAKFYVVPVGSSEALKGYYFHYVVPMFRQGLKETGERKTEEQTEKYLRMNSDVCWEEIVDVKTGAFDTRLREINELSNAELIEHINVVRELAAMELGVFIDDPKSL